MLAGSKKMIEHRMTFKPDPLYEDLKSAHEVAQLFKKIRSNSGITIQQAADETKIRKLWLNYIETGEFDKLPGRVYAIGFSRTYATYLGLDPSLIVKTLQTSADFFHEDDDLFIAPHKEKNKLLTPKITVIISLILVGLIVFSFSYLMQNETLENNTHEVTPLLQEADFDDDLTD
jgi:cytoskeleton protein RodZ